MFHSFNSDLRSKTKRHCRSRPTKPSASLAVFCRDHVVNLLPSTAAPILHHGAAHERIILIRIIGKPHSTILMPAVKPTPTPLPIDAPERRRLPILLRHPWHGLNQASRRRIVYLNITPDQFTVMRTLLESGPITQRMLTESMSSDPNTVASLLERMEKSGLLERRPHEKDRRAHRLHLLPAGKRKYQEAREI